MAAITTDTQRRAKNGVIQLEAAVKGGEKIPSGALFCVDSNGLALNGVTTAGLKCGGVTREGFDNTSGADGALGTNPVRYITGEVGTVRLFACAGAPKAGLPVYLVTNNDVTTVAGNVYVGTLVAPDDEGGSGLWFVHVPGLLGSAAAAQQAAIANLTDNSGDSGSADSTIADGVTVGAALVDNGGGGAADGTIAAITGDQTVKDAVTELAARCNTLRTDSLTHNQNISDLTQKLNAALAALRAAGILSA